MSSDEYQVQDIHRYSRISYKKGHRVKLDDDVSSPRNNIEVTEFSPRSDDRNDVRIMGSPGCSCDMDSEGEIANILHKKCPVITLAQQQLKRLLDETNELLCDNTGCCRSVYDFLCIFKDVFLKKKRCQCALLILWAATFFIGLVVGGATCGSYLRKFNSPILTCIDNFFIPDSYSSVKDSYIGIT